MIMVQPMPFLVGLIILFTPTCYSNEVHNMTLTVAYMIPWTHEWEVGPLMGSAFVLGLESVKQRGLLPGYEIKWTWRDTYCKPLRGIKMAVDIWSKVGDLDAIIGDGCSTICQPVSLLSSSWGIPMISWGCTSPVLSDKSVNPTFSRTIGPWTLLAPMFDKVADEFGWNRVGIVTDTADLMRSTAEATKKQMESVGKTVFFYTIEPTVDGSKINPTTFAKQQKIVRSMKDYVRIIFLFTFSNDFRNFLASAYDEGMITPGYAYVAMDVAHVIHTSYTFRPELDPFIYEGVIIGTPNKPSGPEWDKFAQNVIKSFENPAFSSMPHLPLSARSSEVEVHAGMVHDAVLLWAYGVNKTLSEGHHPDNGVKVTENIFNLTFEGITGRVTIDSNGDRKTNYNIQIVQNGQLTPMMRWDAAKQTMQKDYKADQLDDWSGIVWPGESTSVPRDSPECGWDGELCTKRTKYRTTVTVSVAVVTVIMILVVVAVGLWKKRAKQALQDAISCCIPYQELEILNSNSRRPSLKSSIIDSTSLDHNTSLVLGCIRNELVVIQSIAGGSPNTTDKSFLQDLKRMKEIKHENLNTFIGISFKTSTTYTLMACASRGSLWALIRETTQMTSDFKLSLLHDIAQGLKYLHSSEIESHGHLTSHNCVVDSRWTCKITDYGLKYIRNSNNKHYKVNQDPTDLLWTSPEFLRAKNKYLNFTQPGDIYSFAIISQEVLLQDDPYSANWPQLEPSEIVEELKNPSVALLRPLIPPGVCNRAWLRLMESCWAEHPQQRPNIRRVITLLRDINEGKSFSLVDNMVARLEGYTKDLEELVSERSNDLQDEKSKMEHLLRQLLPASIVEQLKSGMPVVPETFDQVTILFSDIVSFTKICAAGTPTDVVHMLNLVYTLFDDVCAKHDVYKVATIGDAYYLASGVPVRNGNRHAIEICNLSLDLLHSAKRVIIPHMPKEPFRLRFGVHTGPCAAGVAGMKMPRYLLFGDTVDIASHIESAGESMRIHLSNKTAEFVKNYDQFRLISRGEIFIKGLNNTTTYWLEENKD